MDKLRKRRSTRASAPRRASAGPFARLRTQHRALLARLRVFEHALRRLRRGVRDERAFRTLSRWLSGPFAVHVAAEDGVLYPAVARELPELALVLEPLRADHLELAHMTHSLQRLIAEPDAAGRDEQLAVLGRDLVDLLRLHVRSEERSVLDWSERVLPADTLRELRARMARIMTER
jgi:hemerythrin-like domain-containing protein